MFRVARWTFAAATLMAIASAGQAHAQFGYSSYPSGYGGYGWGGWGGGGGGTVEGSIARGLGAYAQGVGAYNQETAVARSINTDTATRWNEYWYEAQVNANHNERLRLDKRFRRDAASSDLAYKRVLDDPTPDDISNGDALNAALDQISNPRVHSSALRLATDKLPGKLVRQIPFVNASEAVTISLDRLTNEDGWPAALRESTFDVQRRAYSSAIDKALKEDENGEISDATLAGVRDALSRLRAKFEANRPTDPARYGASETYLKSLTGMTRLLERPDVEKVIGELETIKETTLGSLLGFMHTFNLRFGRATTPAQRAAYEQIYPLIDSHRDRIVKETGPDDKKVVRAADAPPPPPHPGDFYKGMHLDHLSGKKTDP